MRRRAFLASAGTALALSPISFAASRRPGLALLNLRSREASEPQIGALRAALKALGWIEGQTIEIDERYANGDYAALTAAARALLVPHPDVVLADVPSAVVAAHQAAPDVPIVCPLLSDSLIPALIANYGHPGGAVTGVTTITEGMYGKMVDITREVLPGIKRIGLLVNPQNSDFSLSVDQITVAARADGLALTTAESANESDLAVALQQFVAAQVEAVVVPPNGFFLSVQSRIVSWSLEAKCPLIFTAALGAETGGLVSYGVDTFEPFQLAAVYVDKILKGGKPGDLPVEFPTKLRLVVNLKTAKLFGIRVPQSLLNVADQVIE